MEFSNRARPVRLSEADLSACLALSNEAGWNQTIEDWRFFLRGGRLFGLRSDERLVATAAGMSYGKYAVVSMVLVATSARRRGYATRLLAHVLQSLGDEASVVMLDSPPEAIPVYRRQGFEPLVGVTRYRIGNAGRSSRLGRSCAGTIDRVVQMDAAVSGTERGGLFAEMMCRPASRLVADGEGFALARQGMRACQIGPLVAPSDTMARQYLERILLGMTGPVLIDVPDYCTGFINGLEELGFVARRHYTRMTLGVAAPQWQRDRIFAFAGPEFG